MFGCIVPVSMILILIGGGIIVNKAIANDKKFSVHWSYNGWWAKIEGEAAPFGAWRMDRGPYPYKWMAQLEFPIERLTKDGPRR